MKKKLTPLEEKLQDLDNTRKRCITEWSFKKLRTYRDLIRSATGEERNEQTDELNKPVTYREVFDFFAPFEQQIKDEFNKPAESILLDNKESSALLADSMEDELRPCAESEKLPPSPKQKAFLFPFQERAAKKLLDGIIVHSKRGQLLRAGVGTGKTYIVGALARRLLDMNFCQGKTFSPWPIVYVTRASIVEQSKRVLREQFGICTLTEVQVINIEALRASFGDLMVRAETVVERGEAHIVWKWRKGVHPLIILLDECQAVKNPDSQQSRILQAFNDIDDPTTFQVYFSATPFMRVAEAKCFAVSTKLKTKYGLSDGVPLSNHNWSSFATHVAHPAEPEEYSPAAVERLMTKVDDHVVDVKGVRSQFKAINNVQIIEFQSETERKYYQDAWERYEEICRKIKGYELSGSQSRFLILAQFTVFRKAAELCRAPWLAKAAIEILNTGTQVPVIAVSFKGTIRKMVDIWVNDYNIPRNEISLIWGGGKTKITNKQKVKSAIVNSDILQAALKELGMNISALDLDDVQDYVDDEEDPALRLGPQSLKERQKEIDRFQKGTAKICAFTLKAGGVGLSLHHTDEFTKEKVRRKKNGWAIVEDIPNIPTKQRVCLLTPSFSAIELVQGLGRCPRLTSLSDTPQTMVFYRGTIEERVAAIVSMKLRCLRKVVRSRESWEDTIVGGVPDAELTPEEKRQMQQTKIQEPDDEESDGFFGEDDSEE